MVYRYHEKKVREKKKKNTIAGAEHRAGRGGLSGPASGGYFSAQLVTLPNEQSGERIAEGETVIHGVVC
jgi:hypothetical protein